MLPLRVIQSERNHFIIIRAAEDEIASEVNITAAYYFPHASPFSATDTSAGPRLVALLSKGRLPQIKYTRANNSYGFLRRNADDSSLPSSDSLPR